MLTQTEGRTMFNDIYDLTYNLLKTIGLYLDVEGTVLDQETRTPLMFHGCRMKSTVRADTPCFAGQGEIIFDILSNVRLVTTLLGFTINREAEEGFSVLSHYIDKESGTKRTALCIKTSDYNLYSTLYYNNKCLKFIDAMFMVTGENVDLSNFDISEGEDLNYVYR